MTKRVNITETVIITNNRVKPFSGKRKYLATGDLVDNKIDTVVSVDYPTKPSRADLLVNAGDIILARMQGTNKVLNLDNHNKNLIVSTGFLTLTPKEGYDSEYLTHYFRTEQFQKEKDKYCSGATQKAINNSAFKKLEVPHHTLKEQIKIAIILNAANNLRQKRKHAIQLIDDLLRSTFIDMFGDPMISNHKYKTIRLGLVSSFVGGGTPSRKNKAYYQGNNLWATSKDMKGLILKHTKEKISDQAILESSTKRVKPATILVVVKSKILMRYLPVLITDKETFFNQDIKGIIPRKGVLDPWYLLFHMRIGQNALLQLARGANTEGLTLEHLRNYDLIMAPMGLQDKFASIAKKYVIIIEKMCHNMTQMDNEFNSLAQRYFE